ncbi:MAG TPA: hypothetical protein PK760_03065, partial [Flavobacteriales bacterium]|nr:hypothetical protein [Flavobacteriales bacterium]
NSVEGVQLALVEYNRLVGLVKARFAGLTDGPSGYAFSSTFQDDALIAYGCEGVALAFEWHYESVNTLDSSALTVKLCDVELFGRFTPDRNRSRVYATGRFHFTQGQTNEYGWAPTKSRSDFISGEVLLEIWLKQFLTKIQEVKLRRQAERIR